MKKKIGKQFTITSALSKIASSDDYKRFKQTEKEIHGKELWEVSPAWVKVFDNGKDVLMIKIRDSILMVLDKKLYVYNLVEDCENYLAISAIKNQMVKKFIYSLHGGIQKKLPELYPYIGHWFEDWIYKYYQDEAKCSD